MDKKTIRDIEVSGKRVLVRVDFNVPIKDGAVNDDTRMRAALPTLTYLLDHGAALVLMSHLGRPKGGPDPKYTMQPLVGHLSELLGRPVQFADDCVGPTAEAAAHTGGVSIRPKRRTIWNWPGRWPGWATSSSTMPLARPIAPIHPPKGWRVSCPRWLVF